MMFAYRAPTFELVRSIETGLLFRSRVLYVEECQIVYIFIVPFVRVAFQVISVIIFIYHILMKVCIC